MILRFQGKGNRMRFETGRFGNMKMDHLKPNISDLIRNTGIIQMVATLNQRTHAGDRIPVDSNQSLLYKPIAT